MRALAARLLCSGLASPSAVWLWVYTRPALTGISSTPLIRYGAPARKKLHWLHTAKKTESSVVRRIFRLTIIHFGEEQLRQKYFA